MAHLRLCKKCNKTFLTVLKKSKVCDECKNDNRILQGVKYSNPVQRKEIKAKIERQRIKKGVI